MPTYNNAIPQPQDILSDSQDDILQNFQQLSTVFALNHHTYEAVGQGKHKQVTLPENVAPTATVANEANIYSQNNALTGQTELWWQREGAGDIISWTAADFNNNGWTYLPSGILVQWGTETKTGFNQTVVLPVGNPPLTLNAFYVGITPKVAAGITTQANFISFDFFAGPPQEFNVNCFNLAGAPVAVTFNYVIIGI